MRCARWASWCGRWWSSKPTTRWRLGPRWRRRTVASSASSSARRTRISRSASAARASCNSTGGETSRVTKPASWKSSAFCPPRSPTTWRSSATRPMVIPVFAAGGRSRRRRCSPSSATSRRFPTTGRPGASTRPTLQVLPRRFSASGITRSSFATWRRCVATSRCLTSIDELEWRGPTPAFAPLATRLDTAAHE